MRRSIRRGPSLWTAPLILVGLAAGFSPATEPQDPKGEHRLRVAAFTIVTEQFPRMVAFYRDVLGLKLELLDEKDHFAQFANGAVQVHLTTPATMKHASGSSKYDERRTGRSFELAFELSKPGLVDKAYARIVANGATPVAAPADKPWGQRMAFFADPDGNIHDLYAKR